MITKVFLLKVLIVDHDELGLQEAIQGLINGHFPNDCIRPEVVASRETEIDWSDDHPLNFSERTAEVAKKLFPGF